MVCEKCWEEAYARMKVFGGSQTDHYNTILKEKEKTPCTLKEQAGKYWSDGIKNDKRFYKEE